MLRGWIFAIFLFIGLSHSEIFQEDFFDPRCSGRRNEVYIKPNQLRFGQRVACGLSCRCDRFPNCFEVGKDEQTCSTDGVCVCIGGYFRRSDGLCVPYDRCPGQDGNNPRPPIAAIVTPIPVASIVLPSRPIAVVGSPAAVGPSIPPMRIRPPVDLEVNSGFPKPDSSAPRRPQIIHPEDEEDGDDEDKDPGKSGRLANPNPGRIIHPPPNAGSASGSDDDDDQDDDRPIRPSIVRPNSKPKSKA